MTRTDCGFRGWRLVNVGRLHINLVYNPVISFFSERKVGGFFSLKDKMLMSTLRVGHYYFNLDIV